MVLFFTYCATSYPASLPLSFNNCEISLDESLEIMNKIESDNEINLDMDDEIISGSTFTHQGEVTHEATINILKDS